MSDKMIIIGRPAHLSSATAYEQVEARYGKIEISDACAATIASWWQSPGRDGIHFAALSTSGTVDYDGLSDNIHRARNSTTDPADCRALDMLSTWAISKIM